MGRTISVDDEVYRTLVRRMAEKRMKMSWKAWSINDIMRDLLGLKQVR